MKTLSIQQPWAWLILRGGKNIENRTWATKHRGPFLIHASKKIDKLAAPHHMAAYKRAAMAGEPGTGLGGIVGRANLTKVVKNNSPEGRELVSDNPWFDGPYGFILKDPKTLAFWECRGLPGFFEANHDEE